MHYFLSFIFLFFLLGCSTTQTRHFTYKNINNSYSNGSSSKIIYNQEKTDKSGVIKGTITSLKYNKTKGSWFYEVNSLDTSNGKLTYLQFFSKKKIANLGASIYAIVQDGRLVEHFLLKKAKVVKKNRKVKKLKKQYKRTKSRKTPWIEVPKSESIVLE